MTAFYGYCCNSGHCALARPAGPVRVPPSEAFFCPDCGEPLVPAPQPRKPPPRREARTFALVAAACGIAGMALGGVMSWLTIPAERPAAKVWPLPLAWHGHTATLSGPILLASANDALHMAPDALRPMSHAHQPNGHATPGHHEADKPATPHAAPGHAAAKAKPADNPPAKARTAPAQAARVTPAPADSAAAEPGRAKAEAVLIGIAKHGAHAEPASPIAAAVEADPTPVAPPPPPPQKQAEHQAPAATAAAPGQPAVKSMQTVSGAPVPPREDAPAKAAPPAAQTAPTQAKPVLPAVTAASVSPPAPQPATEKPVPPPSVSPSEVVAAGRVAAVAKETLAPPPPAQTVTVPPPAVLAAKPGKQPPTVVPALSSKLANPVPKPAADPVSSKPPAPVMQVVYGPLDENKAPMPRVVALNGPDKKPGQIQVDCWIATNGLPSDCKKIYGFPGSKAQAAIIDMLQSGMLRRPPTMLNGHAVAARQRFTVEYAPAPAASD